VKPETKFYVQIKKNFKEFSLIRLENLSVPGTPDLLVYNNNCNFFTIELKVTKTNKIKFSPHQIGFHVKHPLNTFILVLDASLNVPKLYEGKEIRVLASRGLKLEPKRQGFPDIKNFLKCL
jgi:Holliday junction resolvase